MNFVFIASFTLLTIVLWIILDFTLGRRRHLLSVNHRETGILHGHFDIYMHGKEFFEDYFREIRNARHHVHVLFYIVKDDRFSQEFLGLLMDKAREGVEVRLLVDRLGSWRINRKDVKRLEASGVQVAFSDRVQFPFVFYSSQVRNHRKVTVIDGKLGYLGGFNIGKEYIDEKPKLSPWRDYHLKIMGEGVSFLQSEFFRDWRRARNNGLQESGKPYRHRRADLTKGGKGSLRAMGGFFAHRNFLYEVGSEVSTLNDFPNVTEHHYFPKLEKGDVRHQFVPTEAGLLEERFIMMVRKAREKIIIGTPYFIPSKRLFAELMSTLRNGVKITLLVPYTADHALVQEASYRFLRQLLREGAQVYQYKNGFYHAKTLIIDDKICDIGTANFDKRSLYLNKEMNCYLYDPNFIARVKEVLNKDLLDSEPLQLATLTKFNPYRTIKELIAGTLSYFL